MTTVLLHSVASCSSSGKLQFSAFFAAFRTRPAAEKKQIMSSYSRQSSTASNTSNSSAGTSSFLVGRDRQRQPEMEFFRYVNLKLIIHINLSNDN